MRFEARTTHGAVSLALEASQAALSCVSQAVLVRDRARLGHHTITTGGAEDARTAGAHRIGVFEDYLSISEAGRERVERVAYRYRIIERDRELLVFHWNPEGPEGRPFPHLHLGAAAELGNRSLTRAHIPTGQVGLSDVVRLLIEELGVRTRRADWRAVLGDAVG